MNFKRTIAVQYLSGGLCAGDAGHQILQPINSSGTISVFKLGSTVPTKFRVCDANLNSVSTANLVTAYGLTAAANSPNVSVDEDVYSTTPDTAFCWDPSGQQWIFNQSTKNNSTLKLLGWKEQLLPKHPMAEAVNYALGRWEALNVFTTDGAVPIRGRSACRQN